jgi:transcriptional regulator with XRE-family HTH domain
MTMIEDATREELHSLSQRLRSLRNARGWTLDELAQRADLSKSYLSRLEDGDRQPSIAALLSLAQAHGVPLASLFASSNVKASCAVVRNAEAVFQDGNGLKYSLLSQPSRSANMQPIRVIVSAERSGDEMYEHDGEEWLYVLSGDLCLIIADEKILLHPGDAAHFDARAPHRLTSASEGETEIILVACAGPRMLLDSYW